MDHSKKKKRLLHFFNFRVKKLSSSFCFNDTLVEPGGRVAQKQNKKRIVRGHREPMKKKKKLFFLFS